MDWGGGFGMGRFSDLGGKGCRGVKHDYNGRERVNSTCVCSVEVTFYSAGIKSCEVAAHEYVVFMRIGVVFVF